MKYDRQQVERLAKAIQTVFRRALNRRWRYDCEASWGELAPEEQQAWLTLARWHLRNGGKP